MNCAEATTRLSAYHDGQLPPATRETIADHLADCPACRAQLDRLAQVDAATVASADRLAARFDTAKFAAAVARRIDAEATPQRNRRARWRLAIVAGPLAAAAGLLLAVGLWPQRPESLNSPAESTADAGSHASATPARLTSLVTMGQVKAPSPMTLTDALADATGPQTMGVSARSAIAEAAPATPSSASPPTVSPGAASALADALSAPRAVAIRPLPIDPGARPFAGPAAVTAPPAARGETLALQPPPRLVTEADAGALAVPSPLSDTEYANLLRSVEVVLTRAVVAEPGDSREWSELSALIRQDDLIGRVRRARRPLPADSRLTAVLAAAEVMLIRTELAADWPSDSVAVQNGIRDSGILDRCRELRT